MASRVRITLRALEDLKNIGRYTERQWGRSQRNIYLRELDNRFLWLARNPRLGRPRDDIAPGYRSFAHEAHIVFYLISDGGIEIIGVPHQAMDIPSHFASHDGEAKPPKSGG